MSEIIIKGKITGINASQFFNKDESGNDVPGRKSIQVQMAGGFSFRTQEGDDNFLDVTDYVRTGSVVEVKSSGLIPAPYQSMQSLPSGGEVEVTRYFLNLEDVEILNIEEPVRKEKFTGLTKKEDQLVFAHREGRARRGKKSQGPEELPEGQEETTY